MRRNEITNQLPNQHVNNIILYFCNHNFIFFKLKRLQKACISSEKSIAAKRNKFSHLVFGTVVELSAGRSLETPMVERLQCIIAYLERDKC